MPVHGNRPGCWSASGWGRVRPAGSACRFQISLEYNNSSRRIPTAPNPDWQRFMHTKKTLTLSLPRWREPSAKIPGAIMPLMHGKAISSRIPERMDMDGLPARHCSAVKWKGEKLTSW